VTGDGSSVRDVLIRDAEIRLGQLLKLADLVDTGADAKAVLADGQVTVNGEVENRRGRRLVPGDLVELAGRVARVARVSSVDHPTLRR
jgi:ribosome-associated protein